MVMVGPMVVLAVLAVFSGFWNVNGGFAAFMGEGETKNFFVGLFAGFTHPLPWIALLVAGKVRACGVPQQVLTEQVLSSVYNVPVHVVPHPDYGSPLILPDGRFGASL